MKRETKLLVLSMLLLLLGHLKKLGREGFVGRLAQGFFEERARLTASASRKANGAHARGALGTNENLNLGHD